MSDGAIARYDGRNVGMIAGLFAFLQVLVSVSSARANILLMRATQDVITNITNNTVQTPFNLLSDLVPTLVATYTSMLSAALSCSVSPSTPGASPRRRLAATPARSPDSG